MQLPRLRAHQYSTWMGLAVPGGTVAAMQQSTIKVMLLTVTSILPRQNLKKKVCVLPLKEIAEEVASVLEYECPHVTSLVCPSLNLHDAKRAEKISLCQLGVPADERKLACSRAVQQRATRKVMHELMGAKRSLPSLCQGEMKQVLCTRSNDARRWMSCMFLSGGHGAELPVGQVPVHDSL